MKRRALAVTELVEHEQRVIARAPKVTGWIELLDAVDYGGPQRSSCGPVSRRVRLGWRSLVGIELSYEFGG